jgi:homoaconitate hydratase
VSVPGLLLVPFLRIGTQGHKGDTGRVKANMESGLDADDGHVDAATAIDEKKHSHTSVSVEKGEIHEKI